MHTNTVLDLTSENNATNTVLDLDSENNAYKYCFIFNQWK